MDRLVRRSQLSKQRTIGEVKRAADLKGIKTALPMVDLQTSAAGASGAKVAKSSQPPVVEKTAASKTMKQTTLTKPPAGDKKKRAAVEEIEPEGDDSGVQEVPPLKKSRTDKGKEKVADQGKPVADEVASAGTKIVVPFAGVPIGPRGCPAAWLDKEFMRQQPLDLPKARTISRGIADVPPLRHFRWGIPNDIQMEIGRGIADRVVLADQTDPRRAFLGSIDDLWGLYGATVSMVGTGLAQFVNDYRNTIAESAKVAKELTDNKKALGAANAVSAGLRGRLSAAEAENEKLRTELAETKRINSELVEQSKSVDQTMKEMKQKISEAQAHWKAEQATCADLRKQLKDLGSSVEGQLKVANDDGFMVGYDQGFYHIARCVLAHDGGTPDLDVLEEWILTHPFSDYLREFHDRIPFFDIELQRYDPECDPDWVAPAVIEANLRERVRLATEARERAAEEGEQAEGEVEQTVEPTESETNADQMLHHSLREENVHNEEMRPENS